MNRSLNVFLGLVVCGGLIAGLFIWTKRSVSDEGVFNPHDFYNSVGGATYSVGGSSGVGMADGGLTVPMRSSSSMFRHRGASSYAPAYSAPNSPIASSPYRLDASASPLYTTSGATMKSFGGGNAMGGGVSMSGGAVSSASNSPIASSPIAYSQSPNSLIASSPIASSPIAYSQSPNSLIASSPVAITDPAAAAASYEGIGNTTGGPRGMRGRQKVGAGNAPTVEDSWLIWLSQHPDLGSSGEGGCYFDQYQLKAAWEEYCASWNVTMGPCPTWEQWYDWFTGGTGTHTWGSGENTFTAHFVPVGEIVPLLVIALLYVLGMFFRSKKVSKIQISRD